MAASASTRVFYEKAVDETKIGGSGSLPPQSDEHVAFLKLSNSAAANFDIDIEHSMDGETWVTLHSFANQTADGIQVADISVTIYGNLRANITRNAGQADIMVDIRHGLKA